MTTADTFCAPLHHYVPAHVETYGPEVDDLAAAVGIDLDPEQRLVTAAAYAVDDRDRLVSTELGVAAPRQNVKTHTAKACSLADLVLFREPQGLWTAHRRDTSDDAFRNSDGTGIADLFESYDFLRRLVQQVTDRDGEKVIELKPAGAGLPRPTLRFMARSERAARGLTGRRVTYDEALFLTAPMVSAMTPILSARSVTGQVQARYLGSPGLPKSDVWRRIRDRGRAGDAKALAWLEWGAPVTPCDDPECLHAPGTDGCALDDPALVAAGNLALHRRIALSFVMTTERESLTPEDFMRERLGWWLDPPKIGDGDLDAIRWAELVDASAPRGDRVVWGVDIDEARVAHLAVAWRRPDGGVQVSLVEPEDDDRPRVSALTADDRLRELTAKWGGTVWLGGPAASLESLVPGSQLVSSTHFAAACGSFADLLDNRSVHHYAQPELDAAVGSARWRNVGAAGRAWQLRDASLVGPLAAVTRALHGLLTAPTSTVNLW